MPTKKMGNEAGIHYKHWKEEPFPPSVAAGPLRAAHNMAGGAIKQTKAGRGTVPKLFAHCGEPMQRRAATSIREAAGKTPNFKRETCAMELQICLCHH